MAEKGPWELVEEADGRELGATAIAAVISFVLAITQGVNSMINTAFDLFVDPLDAVITGSVGVVEELWGGWQAILEQGAETAVASIAPGATWAVGPFTQALSLVSVVVSLYILAKVMASPFTSNLVPGTLVDNRFVSWLSSTPEEEDEK